jgi:hypothetical protein
MPNVETSARQVRHHLNFCLELNVSTTSGRDINLFPSPVGATSQEKTSGLSELDPFSFGTLYFASQTTLLAQAMPVKQRNLSVSF